MASAPTASDTGRKRSGLLHPTGADAIGGASKVVSPCTTAPFRLPRVASCQADLPPRDALRIAWPSKFPFALHDGSRPPRSPPYMGSHVASFSRSLGVLRDSGLLISGADVFASDVGVIVASSLAACA